MNALLRALLLALTTVALACQPTQPPSDDAGPQEPPPDYEGEATGGPPDFTDGVVDTAAPSDGGASTMEATCCWLTFSIPGAGEPQSAVGRVRGDVAPLNSGGAPLVASDGGFSARSCTPKSVSYYYWFEFTWPTADADAGNIGLEDGGYLVVKRRVDSARAVFDVGGGQTANFVPSTNSCAELDAGTGP